MERDVLFAQRELIPLTTGLIADVKRVRSNRLRQKIWARRDSAVKIQALWRRALVRCALYDPHKEYWIMKIDQELLDKPFYFNLESRETVTAKPLAYTYFGDRYKG